MCRGKVVLLEECMAEVLADFIPIFHELGIDIQSMQDLIQKFGSELPFIILEVVREFAEKREFEKMGVVAPLPPAEAGGQAAEALLLYLHMTGRRDVLSRIARAVLEKLVEKIRKKEIAVAVPARQRT